MELILPIAIFLFAIYILGSGRRAANLPRYSAASRAEWDLDSTRGRRIGDSGLDDLKRTFGRFESSRPESPIRRPRDRKSTRLNSSHLGISYAVFCLKKKNKQNRTINTNRHCRAH